MPKKDEKIPLAIHLLAGGGAGFAESVTCHPLDTIKVRMQLTATAKASSASSLGPVGTAVSIVRHEGFFALYKGLSAVVAAIVPKMAIRFSSFEFYKSLLKDKNGKSSISSNFFAGLGAGITETIIVVNPIEVIKIRLQAQKRLSRSHAIKYKNGAHAAITIVKEEGFGALYRGVTLTAARQATNQAVNFTVYHEMKRILLNAQGLTELPSYQHLLLGGLSGGLAPIANSPIDTVKTRIQRQTAIPGQSAYQQIKNCALNIYHNEGFFAFYKGLTPRLLRIAPGQAITFMVYEKLYKYLTTPTSNGFLLIAS